MPPSADHDVPLVSIIVPCRNEEAYIRQFLTDIQNQQFPHGTLEVLIVDGDSTDATRQIIQEATTSHTAMRVLDNPEGAVSPGLNRAIRAARGSIIIRMDVHTRYADDYVARCVEVLEDTGAANVGGAARTISNGYWGRVIAAAYSSPITVGTARFHFPDYEGEVDTVPYGAWKKSTLVDVGGFDESLVRNQDDELNLRLRKQGGKIWQSKKIRSWYRPRASLKTLFQQYFQYGYWRVAVIRKHHIPASWRHVVPPLFVIAIILGSILSIFSPSVRTPLLTLSGVYALFLVIGSVWTCRKNGFVLLLGIPIAIATYHIAYGLGFLVALFRHGTDSPLVSATKLTR